MSNPLKLLGLLQRVVRPSRVSDMRAVCDTFWLRSNYDALTFFGYIVTRSRQDADHFNSHYDALKNHEMIHLRQAQATGDSWLRFYGLYLWYWLRGLRWNRRMKGAAYRLNPFELEAYRHDRDFGYPARCAEGGAQEWRKYAGMKYEELRGVYFEIFGR